MADYIVTGPDGQKYKLSADNDAAIQHAVAQMFGGNGPDAAKAEAAGRGHAKENYAAGVLDSVAKGQSFGLSDELGAAANATFAPAARAVLNAVGLRQPQPTDNDTWGQRYDQNLAYKRGFTQQFEQDNPKAAMAANIGGNALTSMAALPAAATAAGPSLGGNMLRMGATGAALGGVQGFAEGEGGADNRTSSALKGAAFGGGIGAAIPVAGAMGRVAMESAPGRWLSQNVVAPVAQRVAGAFEGRPARSLSAAAPDGTPGVTGPLTEFAQSAADPSRTGAIERLAVAAQRSGLSREQFERKLAELGPEAMLADLDPQFLAQARMAHTREGETRTLAKTVLESREAGRPDRIAAAFKGDEPFTPTYKLLGDGKEYDQYIRNVGQRAYQGDMADAGLKQTPELMALYDNEYVDAALKSVMGVEKKARGGRPDAVPASPVEIMHKVKQKIWDMGFDGATGKPGAEASYFRDLGTDFVNKLKAANPELAKADLAYSQAMSRPENFQQGYNFLTTGRGEKSMNASSSALADTLASGDPLVKSDIRAGMTNAAVDEVSGRGNLARSLSLARDLDPRTSREIAARIAQAYEPAHAAEIGRVGAAEKTFAETTNEILRGSKSADKLADIFDNAGVRVTNGGPSLKWWDTFKDIAAKATGANEEVRNKIGQIAFNPRSDENRRLLAEILARIDQRRSGRSLSAALAGTSGAQFGGP